MASGYTSRDRNPDWALDALLDGKSDTCIGMEFLNMHTEVKRESRLHSCVLIREYAR